MPEQFIVLLVIAAISVVEWLVRQSRERRERKRVEELQKRGETAPRRVAGPLEAPRPTAGFPTRGEEELRKFLEALGVPANSTPPPPIPQPPIVVRHVEHPVPAGVVLPAPTAAAVPSKRRVPTAEERALARRLAAEHPPIESETISARSMLKTKEGLRAAFVLREVLGKPVALQSE